jgi:hypothetical protein
MGGYIDTDTDRYTEAQRHKDRQKRTFTHTVQRIRERPRWRRGEGGCAGASRRARKRLGDAKTPV